jgi:hypothetical protein
MKIELSFQASTVPTFALVITDDLGPLLKKHNGCVMNSFHSKLVSRSKPAKVKTIEKKKNVNFPKILNQIYLTGPVSLG